MSETRGCRPTDEIEALGAVVEQLAPAHAAALRLAENGADATAIAACLGIPVEAVAGVLEMATAKLARLRREGAPR